MNKRGFTLIELLGVMAILGVLVAIAMPSLHSIRLGAALSSAHQDVSALLNRARWMAITSGRSSTTVALDGCAGTKCTAVVVKNGATNQVLASANLDQYYAQVSATDFPLNFDNRGFLASGQTPTVTVESTKVSGTKILTVSPLGKVSS